MGISEPDCDCLTSQAKAGSQKSEIEPASQSQPTMSQVRRRLPMPRIRDWKTAMDRRTSSSRPSSASKPQLLQKDESFALEGIQEGNTWQDLEEPKREDSISDLCDPDFEPLPPTISLSPFPKRTTIMRNVLRFEASVSPDSTDGDKDYYSRRNTRENKSLDSMIVHMASSKKALWSSSSAIPGRVSCDSPPMMLEPCRSLSTKSDSPDVLRSPTTLFMPDDATLTVDHRISEPSSEQYDMLQSVTQSTFMGAIDDTSLPKASIQIFPHGLPETGIQLQERGPAVDRFLLAHQIRRISMHRSKLQLDQDADRRVASEQILQAFHEKTAILTPQTSTSSRSEGCTSEEPEFFNSPRDVSDMREGPQLIRNSSLKEGQQKKGNRSDKPLFEGGEPEVPVKISRKGIYMDITIDDEHAAEGKVGCQRKAPVFLRRKSRISRQNIHKPTPSPRPDSRLLPRSNRTLIRNAISRVCLAGGATGSERARALDALDSCTSEWFIILLREQRHKFRGLFRVEASTEGNAPVIQRIFGDGPQQIPAKSISAYFKYDSANKCFDSLPTRHLTATTDAVSIIPRRYGSKPTRTL